MNEQIVTHKNSSFWESVKKQVFQSEDKIFPVWVFAGPLFSFLTSALFFYFQSSLSIFLGMTVALSLLFIYQFRAIGYVVSLLLMVYPLFVQSTATNGQNFLFSLSFTLGYGIFLLSLEEFYKDKKLFSDDFENFKQQAALWKRRFDTLSVQHEEIKEELESQKLHLQNQQTEFEDHRRELDLLIEESSRDASVMQEKNEKLFDEILKLKKNQHKTHLNEELEEMLNEKISELNELRTRYHQLELNQSKEDSPKKKIEHRPQISGDELLFSFYDVSHNALETIKKYKNQDQN